MASPPQQFGPMGFTTAGFRDDHEGHDHDHPHHPNDGHDHGQSVGHGSGHAGSFEHQHGPTCVHAPAKVSPWNILPWDEIEKSYECDPLEIEHPTMTSNCQAISDWETALSNGTLAVNQLDERGYSGLHYAVRRGNLNLVKFLESKHADLFKNTEDNLGDTCLHLAVKSGDVPTLVYMLDQGHKPDAKNAQGFTVINQAISSSHLIQAVYMMRRNPECVNSVDSMGRTPLHMSMVDGSFNILREVLLHNPDPFVYDKQGFLPIHHAASTGNPHGFVELAKHNFIQCRRNTTKGETSHALALESGQKDCIEVTRQILSLAKWPGWFYQYMWSWTALSWISVYLFASLILNFWVLLVIGGVMIRIIYSYTFTEQWKTSKNPTFLSCVLIGSFYAMVIFIWKLLPHSIESSPILSILVFPLLIGCIELLRRLLTKDPGYHYYTAADALAFAAEAHGKREVDNMCETCIGIRPIRTKHCPKCDRCVDDLQHHCSMTNICISKRNHGTFVLLLILCSTTCLLWLYLSGSYLSASKSNIDVASPFWSFKALMEEDGLFTILAGFTIGLAGISLYTLGLHAKYIAYNVTPYEEIYWERYGYMRDAQGDFQNPYDKGVSANLKEFLQYSISSSSSRPDNPKDV